MRSAAFAFVPAVAGCGAAGPDSSTGSVPGETEAADIGSVTQASTESSCGTTAPDESLVTGCSIISLQCYATAISPTPAYDHPTCRNAYIAQIEEPRAWPTDQVLPHLFTIRPVVEGLDTLFCDYWVKGGVYRKTTTGWTRVSSLSATSSKNSDGTCKLARATHLAVSAGTYKVVGEAGRGIPTKHVRVELGLTDTIQFGGY